MDVPKNTYEAECMLGALLLAAERLDEHEARTLLIKVRHDANAQTDRRSRAFFDAYAAVIAARVEE